MYLLIYLCPTINKKETNKEQTTVILKALDIIWGSIDLSSLYCATYFVIPLPMPPFANPSNIVTKLFNCPTRATPAGPIIEATTLTLIKPDNILTNVDIAFKENTLTISTDFNLLNNCLIVSIKKA